jgi:16S rRNA (cytosine967-C5)-methyltransferase
MSPLHPHRVSVPLLLLCSKALQEVMQFTHPADATLSRFFRQHAQAGRQDRALVADTVYSALRRWRLLQALVPEGTPRQLVLAAWALLLGLGRDQLTNVCRVEEHEWLGNLVRAAAQARSFEVECDLSDWVIEALRQRFDEAELLRHARAFHSAAPLDLRVNLVKSGREEVLARLAAEGMEAMPTPHSPFGIRLAGNPAINRHALFLSGDIEVQDEGSQLLSLLVEARRKEMVVDLCAGAGGKTLALGALMRSTGRLYAFDISARRLEKLRPRLVRSGLQNVHVQCIDGEGDVRLKRLAGKIDRVLVDAPCSGLGTLRRNPDLKMRQGPESVSELVVRQTNILNAAARLAKSGGRIVYATCSILAEENQHVVSAFLDRHPDFSLLPVQGILDRQHMGLRMPSDMLELWPAEHGTDGFFAAVLERRT